MSGVSGFVNINILGLCCLGKPYDAFCLFRRIVKQTSFLETKKGGIRMVVVVGILSGRVWKYLRYRIINTASRTQVFWKCVAVTSYLCYFLWRRAFVFDGRSERKVGAAAVSARPRFAGLVFHFVTWDILRHCAIRSIWASFIQPNFRYHQRDWGDTTYTFQDGCAVVTARNFPGWVWLECWSCFDASGNSMCSVGGQSFLWRPKVTSLKLPEWRICYDKRVGVD